MILDLCKNYIDKLYDLNFHFNNQFVKCIFNKTLLSGVTLSKCYVGYIYMNRDSMQSLIAHNR